MSAEAKALVTEADRVLVWLKILTIFLGGMATLAVVFLADVMTAKLANPVGVAGIDAVKMSEVEELHHWIGYKVALAAMDDKDVVYHVKVLFDTATDAKQKSALDGVLVEHMPAGHFIHTKNILKELLGDKAAPPQLPLQLEAKVALALLKENKLEDARAQVEHMLTVATGTAKEVIQGAMESLQKGDGEGARQQLTGLVGG